jgi:DNA-binding transcriptional LysR family regulator
MARARFNWDDLRYFLAVARTGRFSSAAQSLQQTHMTVSRRLAALEDALATKLFSKRSDGYALTSAGHRLLLTAERMEEAILEARHEIGGCGSALDGVVRVSAPASFGSYFLARRLPRLRHAHSSLRLELAVQGHDFDLSTCEADIIISLVQPTRGRFVSRKLTDFQLGFYATAELVDRAPSIEALADLHEHLLIEQVENATDAAELKCLAEMNHGASTRFFSADITAQLQATLAGEGICILPHFIARTEPSLRPVLPSFTMSRSLWLITHTDTCGMARIRETAEFIAREVRVARAHFVPCQIESAAENDRVERGGWASHPAPRSPSAPPRATASPAPGNRVDSSSPDRPAGVGSAMAPPPRT